jgi:APA family basic amino acid/polyamine antiporter
MASTTGIRPASPPPSGPGQPGPPAGQEQGAALGLVSATGLVMGSIIGVGVFTMPAVLAEAGTSSLVVMAVVAAGAMLLAVLFGQLTRRVPSLSRTCSPRAPS